MKQHRTVGITMLCLMLSCLLLFTMNIHAFPEVLDIRVEGYTGGTPGILHIIDHEPLFSWTNADPGGPDQGAYELEVWTESDANGTLMWATGMRNGTETNVTYNDDQSALPLLDGEDYYVSVRTWYPTVGWSPWNETMFHMNTPPPEPTFPHPPHNATGIPPGSNTTVAWSSGGNDSEGDQVYFFWMVAEDPWFDKPLASNWTYLTTSDPFYTSPGTTYYWRVIADDGWESSQSPTWIFTTDGSYNVDYILIRDAPQGGGTDLSDPANYPSYFTGHSTTFFGAAYNYSTGYIGDVPSSSTWNSSDTNIVTVTSPGSYSTVSCSDTKSGTATITLDDGYGHTTFTVITVLPVVIDYIQIRDAPGGGGNDLGDPANFKTYPVDHVATFYGAAYNNSYGYVNGVPVNSTWDSSDTTLVVMTSPGSYSTITCSMTNWGTATVTLDDNDGHTNTTEVTILEPTLDYILIRDAPGGGGFDLSDSVNYPSYHVGASDIFYGAEYNDTAGYLKDVPGTSTWTSSDTDIVDVTSPGTSTTISCSQTDWGTVTIKLEDESGHSSTTEVTVLEPGADYIQIRDEPDGLGNIVTVRTYIVYQTDVFYAACYNDTAGYIGDVDVEWISSDTAVATVTTPGTWTTLTAQKVDVDSTCQVTVYYNGIMNSTGDLTVLAPTIDFISIVDSSDGTGQWVASRTYNEGDSDVFWAAGFNNTADYIKDVKATWESNNTVVGQVEYGPDEYTLFTAGWRGGYCRVTATYGSLTSQTGPLYVINVNQLPTANAVSYSETGFAGGDYSFRTDITLRVTGRKENIITMELEEDGVAVEDVAVTRHSNEPDIGVLSYEVDANSVYDVILRYNGHNGGSNPIIVTYEFLGNTYSVHFLFNSKLREQQTAKIHFNDILQRVGVIFTDGFASSDFEGYLVDYHWDFGDGTSATGETLAHSYEENGVYTVTLTVTDDEGGTDTNSITVSIDTIDNNDQNNAAFGQNKEYMDASGYFVLILQCPADLRIMNQDGEQIRVIGDSQVNTVEDAFVAMMANDIEVYYVPGTEGYDLDVVGTGSGLYDLTIASVENGVTKRYRIYNVPCSEDGTDNLDFDFENGRLSISTDEENKYYSLELFYSDDEQEMSFYLTDMELKRGSTHYFDVENWDALISGKPVTISVDEDSDGESEGSAALRTGLTGEEVRLLLTDYPVTASISPILVFLVIGFVFALGLGMLSIEVTKWALLALFLPLATRLKKRYMLDHPTRHEIYGYIKGNPGANFGLIKQEMELGNGQLVYHLKQLEQAHLIYSKIDGKRKRFYPMGHTKPKGGMLHLSSIQKKILGVIRSNSGVSQKKIAAKVGVSHQVASYHLTKMERWGVVEKEVMGRERRYYISETPVPQ